MDDTLTTLASEQHALLTLRQLRDRGCTDGRIRHLLESSRLTVVHPGVYRVTGSVATWEQRLLAACLSIGPEAVGSHRSAASFWALDGPFDGYVEVTAPLMARTRPNGAVFHRSTDLVDAHVTTLRGVPVTNPLRTLVDLGAVVKRPVLDRAVDDALAKRLVSYEGLCSILHDVARRGRRGVGPLRASLGERSGVPQSVLEAELERLIARSPLPETVRQCTVRDEAGRFLARVDHAYPDELVAIEADGAATHSSREALEHDLRRQNRLVTAGWTVLRFTWRDIVGRPDGVVEEIDTVLAIRRAGGLPLAG